MKRKWGYNLTLENLNSYTGSLAWDKGQVELELDMAVG